MTAAWLRLMRRGLQTPPTILATRVVQQMRQRYDQADRPWRTGSLTTAGLLRQLRANSIDVLWDRLAQRPFAASMVADPDSLELISPGAVTRILAEAERAKAHRVDLLGTGEISLGSRIDWHRDFKVDRVWPLDYFTTIDSSELDQPSDVKIPWEISRLQWLIPVGQAYLLFRNDRDAEAARSVLESWISANPCLYGVNWVCTMEAAMRIFVWTWLFHAFHAAPAWRDAEFRAKFLTMLYAHAEYTDRYLEIADINGNHCTADLAALVFAGLFFGGTEEPRHWRRRGWKILKTELPRQTTVDGVDFEGSIPYHRLVAELFLWPALYRLRTGRTVPAAYRNRLAEMAKFAEAYTRPDGGAPQWGDGDDARVLPFASNSLSDHRYLPTLTGLITDHSELGRAKPGPLDEVYWMLGAAAARQAQAAARLPRPPIRSRMFPFGGYGVLQDDQNHVFVDCAPVGQKGRGGHGHNDCLSFEATLAGVRLIVDPGSYVYTASADERNRFRSTACHNTPGVDGEELNRFISPRHLWSLHNDAQPIAVISYLEEKSSTLIAGHTGYLRLADAVHVTRKFLLEHDVSRLEISDELTGDGLHRVEIPLHLAPGVQAESCSPGVVRLRASGRIFRLAWSQAEEWTMQSSAARCSASYGRCEPIVRLSWSRSGALRPLSLRIEPWHAEGEPA